MAITVPTRVGGDRNDPASQDTWRDRIRDARDARKPFEPVWLLNLAFAAGQHWVGWDKARRTVRSLKELDPRYADRELVTADRLNEYRQAQLAELETDDDRPELLVVQEGDAAEEIAEQLNQAIAYAWDHEWDAKQALSRARLYTLDLGVSAIRARFNPNVGPVAGRVPVSPHGQPIVDPLEFAALQQTGMLVDGSLPGFREVREGRTRWDSYSAFGILPPPGCNHEDSFPWEILVRPVPIDALLEEYGSQAAGLVEDADIASAMGLSTSQTVQDERSQGMGQQRLKDHVWLYTCFQRPTRAYPRGAVAVIASNEYALLDFRDSFDYQLANGEYHSGVVYLHWWRLADRFFSRSFTEPLRDPQRLINRRETQNAEIIDRHMPRHYLHRGDLIEEPVGSPGELVQLAKEAGQPVFWEGAGPGAWMYQDIAHQVDNLGHASTISALRLGENPPAVDTYSQLALLNDNEGSKRAVVIRDQRNQIGTLVELGVSDIRRYWPETKKIIVAGEEDQISQALFRKALIPDFYMARIATGSPLPRSQGAELKKVDAIWQAAVQAWVVPSDGAAWISWYSESVKAGTALELPAARADTQREYADLENHLMRAGEQPPVMDYDVLPTHLQVHREAEDHARASGDMALLARIVQHIEEHKLVAQTNVQNAARAAQGLQPLAPGQADPTLAAGNGQMPQAEPQMATPGETPQPTPPAAGASAEATPTETPPAGMGGP